MKVEAKLEENWAQIALPWATGSVRSKILPEEASYLPYRANTVLDYVIWTIGGLKKVKEWEGGTQTALGRQECRNSPTNG